MVLKVLIIGKYYEAHLGGIENHTYNLAQYLKSMAKVTVLAYNKTNKTETFSDKGVKVVKVATLGVIKSQPISIVLSKWVRKLSNQSDIIHIHSPNPLAEFFLTSKIQKKKLIVTHHSDVLRQKFLLQFHKLIYKKLLTKADKIIATTERYAKYSDALKKFHSKIVVIPYGIRIEEIESYSHERVKQIKKKYGPNIILFVGRLVSYKGAEYLLRAMKECRETNLIVIGDGVLRKDLERLKSSLNLKNVFFLPKVDRSDIPNYYQACDIFVLPSVTRMEAFGIVQLEAMAHGKPVITTEIKSGTSSITQNNITGIVVAPRNSKQLARTIQKLISNPGLRQKLGNNGRKKVHANFTSELNHKKIYELYKEVAKQS